MRKEQNGSSACRHFRIPHPCVLTDFCQWRFGSRCPQSEFPQPILGLLRKAVETGLYDISTEPPVPNVDFIVPSFLIKLIETPPSEYLDVSRCSSALLPYGALGDAVKMWGVCWGDCSLILKIFRATVALSHSSVH